MKKLALIVLAIATLAAFCAPVAPVTPRVATNISEHVATKIARESVSNIVTKAFVEKLGAGAGMTPGGVTNIVRSIGGGLWDSKLKVWWTPVMTNGCLIYRATTNVNMNAEVTP